MNFKLLFKGFIIGIAKIIPGVSGSLIALNLGIYEQGIESISHFFRSVKQNIYFLSNVGIGVLLAIIFGSNIISVLLNKYYFITVITIIGLLLGSDFSMTKNLKTKKEVIYMLLTFIIMFSLFFIKTSIKYEYRDNLWNNIYIVILGLIDATTMIIPAISGTVIFMILGSYEFILSIFSNLFSNIKITILFFGGLLIGIILITKIVDNLLKNRKEIIYPIITGFFLSSVLYLIINLLITNYNYIELLISIPIFIISYKIGTLSNN